MMKLKRKGQFSYIWDYVVVVAIILFLFVILIPMFTNMGSGFMNAAQGMFSQAHDSAMLIQNTTIRQNLNGSISSAQNVIPNQIAIITFVFKWWWLILIIVLLLVLMLRARRDVMVNTIG